GRVLQQDPDRYAEGAGEMGYARIDRNQQVEAGEETRGFGEIAQRFTESQNFRARLQLRRVAAGRVALGADERRVNVEKLQKRCELDRGTIFHVRRIIRPDESDPGAVFCG